MTRTPRARRAVSAGVLLTALVASLLGGWFVSGWRDVRMRRAELARAPRLSADQRAVELARELRAELEGLMAREIRRPYFQYQNLMHDPQTSAGFNVSLSPLAKDPEEPLVRGYFQVDTRAHATTPTLNDKVPELSETEHLAEHRAFRDQVARDLSRALAPVDVPGARLLAKAGPSRRGNVPRHTPEPASGSPSNAQPGTAQVIQVDPRVYVQNANPNAVYSQSQMESRPQSRRQPPPFPAVVPAATPEPVTIVISPLEWRTVQFADAPTLIAVRHVQTPDGPLTQGFVVDQQAVAAWLGKRAGDGIATLRPDGALGAPVAPQWGLTVDPNPATVTNAAQQGAAVASRFLLRFAGVSVVSIFTAGLVLLLVTRAEKLAHERSQFAAAAAHELRTPLAGLQLYADMLADGLGDPDKMRDYARRVSEDAARLGRVVSNILGFSQLERGGLAIEPRVGQLDEALAEVAERARPGLERAGARLEVDLSPGLRARFDRDALTRIVGNLLDNAEKYARSASDRTIRLAAMSRGDVVEVIVADRGPGIPDSSHLFRAFSRGANGRDVPAGLGLGLALSRSLARAMGGDLVHKRRDEGGAVFVLELRQG